MCEGKKNDNKLQIEQKWKKGKTNNKKLIKNKKKTKKYAKKQR